MQTCIRAVWLFEPSRLNQLDFEDSAKFAEQTYQTELTLEMAPEWVRLGTVELKFSLLPHSEFLAPSIAALKARLQELDAKTERARTELTAQINNLLAIGN